MARVYARRARSRPGIDRLTLIVIIAFIVVACITAVLAFIWVRSAFPSGARPDSSFTSSGTNDEDYNVPAPSGPLKRETDPTAAPWDGKSRVTILVMGLDYRDWSEGGDIPRTDSMLLASIDPSSSSIGLLSIPRDLWVDIPGYGYNKINTAYRWGELDKVPGGGPGLAMTTVENVIGVPVDYYAMIDFNAFVRIIDEMGGLDMHIREEIVVDPIGPGNTRTLEPGVQTLDGATVLAYARQRDTINNDFDRSERQQEVILAIRKQVLDFNMLPTLIKKAPKLYSEVAAGINTNLTFDQMVKLALLAAKVDDYNIKRRVMDPLVHVKEDMVDGQSVLIPDPEQIRVLRDELFFSGGSTPAPQIAQPVETSTQEQSPQGDLVDLMKAENARVAVINGTSTAGLASRTSEMLRAEGINVVEEGNADQSYNSTTIYDYTGMPYTTQFLIEKFNIPANRVVKRYDPTINVDIEIDLGTDWASKNQQ